MFLEGYEVENAYFTDEGRTTIKVELKNLEPKDDGTFEGVDYFILNDPEDDQYQLLMEEFSLDQIHEATFKYIRATQQDIKRVAIEVAKNNGWLLSDVALEDDVGFKRQSEMPQVSESGEKIVEVIREVEVAPNISDVLINHVFNPNTNSEYLFELKLKLFDQEFIKECNSRDLKKALRISKTVPEAVAAAIAIYQFTPED